VEEERQLEQAKQEEQERVEEERQLEQAKQEEQDGLDEILWSTLKLNS
jgi:hypothetical protein